MQLYIVRHAIAEPRELTGGMDHPRRALTDKGVRRMREIVGALARLGVHLDEIWTSPLTRARQTAELLAELAGFRGRMVEQELLGPAGDLGELVATMRDGIAGASVSHVALVGHEPDLGELVGFLLTSRPAPVVTFKKGGIACVEIDDLGPPVRATLRWMLTPKQLRMICGSQG